MAKQGETTKCVKKGCSGMMTFHKKIAFKRGAALPAPFPPRSRAGKGGWICDKDATHYVNEKP